MGAGLANAPEQYGDTEGTDEIYDFLENFKTRIYNTRCINCGRLVPYIHEPFEVKLTPRKKTNIKNFHLKFQKSIAW